MTSHERRSLHNATNSPSEVKTNYLLQNVFLNGRVHKMVADNKNLLSYQNQVLLKVEENQSLIFANQKAILKKLDTIGTPREPRINLCGMFPLKTFA